MSITKTFHLIIGASSGLGRALAERLAVTGQNVLIVARDRQDLEILCRNLELRNNILAKFIEADIASSSFQPELFFDQVMSIANNLKSINLVAGGSFANDDLLPTAEAFSQSIILNFEAPAKILIEALRRQAQHNCTSILVVSSIAAARPRKMNISYSTAKKSLETLTLALRHSFQREELGPAKVNFQILRLGYMESVFTEGRKLPFPIAKPEFIANSLIKLQNTDCGVIYLPKFWQMISLVMALIPFRIFKRLNI